jgi:hypothetical protein
VANEVKASTQSVKAFEESETRYVKEKPKDREYRELYQAPLYPIVGIRGPVALELGSQKKIIPNNLAGHRGVGRLIPPEYKSGLA